jgi:myo-inositol-1(or 4)-monophosphatase
VDLTGLLHIAEDAARRTGVRLMERWRGPAVGVVAKSTPTDLASEADREAERLLVSFIRSERPDDGTMGEEGGSTPSASGVTWILDPLDGTINFLFGIPVWCVSVAARTGEGVVVGAVYDPTRDEMFSAMRGRGARLNDKPIHTSSRDDLATALIGTGFSYDPRARRVQAELLVRVLPQVRDIRRAGSAALDLTSVACGRLDGVFEAPMEEWDKAAGVLLVNEAGGVTSPLEAPLGLSPGVVAAGARLHDKLRAVVVGTPEPDLGSQARH